MGQLLVWEWQSETYILKQQGHYYDMNTLCYSQDGHYIATGGDDGKVSLDWYLLLPEMAVMMFGLKKYTRQVLSEDCKFIYS